jgi:hypothetical protein
MAVLALILGCGDDDDGNTTGGGGNGAGPSGVCVPGELELDDGSCLSAGTQPNGCAAGEALVDGTCLAAGHPGNGCAVGELALDGECIPAGVAICQPGFVSDANGGCDPVLPAAACVSGQMALLGETACREVSPCLMGIWGGIAIEPDTMHVDSTAAGQQDGSAQNPYKTIQTAIDAASAGAIVAVAAGVYNEDVSISGKAVRLIGKCPGEVQIAGTSTALSIGAGADNTEVHDLAFTSGDKGISVLGSSVTMSKIWVHDTGGWGIESFDAPPDVSAITLTDSLIENVAEQALYVSGSDGVLANLVIRDVASVPSQGWALTVLEDETTFKRATASIDNVVIQRASEVALLVHASDVTMTSIYIENVQPNAQGRFGRGMAIQAVSDSTGPADVTMSGVLVDGASDGGILVAASNVIIEQSVVRNVSANLDKGEYGVGIGVQHDPISRARANVTMRSCLIENTTESGILMGSSDIRVEGALVRDIAPRPSDDFFGRAANFQIEATGGRGTATVVGSVFLRSTEVAVFVMGADVVLESTLVSGTVPRLADGEFGMGVAAQDHSPTLERSDLSIVGSVIEKSHNSGVFIGASDVYMERTIVRETEPNPSGLLGRGINIQDNAVTGQRSNGTVLGSLIENNYEIGIMIAGADVSLEGVLVLDVKPTPTLALGGRGLNIQANVVNGQRASATVAYCHFDGMVENAIFVAGADAIIESTRIHNTLASPSGIYGDGIVAIDLLGGTSALIDNCSIKNNTRAGVSGFGAVVSISGSDISCNDIDLAGESFGGVSVSFEDRGENACGCDQQEACKLLSATLAPPTPFADIAAPE